MRDAKTCPYIAERIEALRGDLRTCSTISAAAGFNVSIELSCCEACCCYELQDNPITAGLVKQALLGRVRCGDSTDYHHSAILTADKALEEAVLAGATKEECLKAIATAVYDGELTVDRASEIAAAAETLAS